MAKIRVTAGEGRRVPIPKDFMTGPGRVLVFLEPGTEILVDEEHHFTVRCRRNGDFTVLKADAKALPPPAGIVSGAPAPEVRKGQATTTTLGKE